MTQEQFDLLQRLIFCVQDLARTAYGQGMDFELARAIVRADDACGECFQFIGSLNPNEMGKEGGL